MAANMTEWYDMYMSCMDDFEKLCGMLDEHVERTDPPLPPSSKEWSGFGDLCDMVDAHVQHTTDAPWSDCVGHWAEFETLCGEVFDHVEMTSNAQWSHGGAWTNDTHYRNKYWKRFDDMCTMLQEYMDNPWRTCRELNELFHHDDDHPTIEASALSDYTRRSIAKALDLNPDDDIGMLVILTKRTCLCPNPVHKSVVIRVHVVGPSHDGDPGSMYGIVTSEGVFPLTRARADALAADHVNVAQ